MSASAETLIALLDEVQKQGLELEVIDLGQQYYDPAVAAAAAATGAHVLTNTVPFSEADETPVLGLYTDYMDEVGAGDDKVTTLGVQAFSAGLLFATAADALGADLTRENLVTELEGITEWDGGGVQMTTNPGERVHNACFLYMTDRGRRVRARVPRGGLRLRRGQRGRARQELHELGLRRVEELFRYFVVFAVLAAPTYAIAASGLVVTYTTTGIFNFAHGAIGMIVAFCYWQITSSAAWGQPVWLGLVLCLFVIAPGMGLFLDWAIMRRLAGASTITTIVATIGLLFALVSLADLIWPSGTGIRTVDGLFEGHTFTLAGVVIDYHDAVSLVAAILVAIGLRFLLFGTRTGTAMRAVVDSRELAALNGVNPDRISSVAWMLGCSLAGLAGILLAPNLTLTSIALTLVVIQAYAVAMVGRLRSLPLTFLGALILAEVNSAFAYVQNQFTFSPNIEGALGDLASATPALMLLVVLIVIREDKAALRPENIRFRVPRPSLQHVATIMGGLVLVAVVVARTSLVSANTVDELGKGLAFGVIILSLVLLTGLGRPGVAGPAGLRGPVGPRGLEAAGPTAWWPASSVTALVGALVALPALRMRSLYLALTTMAFALLMEKVIFGNNAIFSAFRPFASTVSVERFTFLRERRRLLRLHGRGLRAGGPRADRHPQRPLRPSSGGHEGLPGRLRHPRASTSP